MTDTVTCIRLPGVGVMEMFTLSCVVCFDNPILCLSLSFLFLHNGGGGNESHGHAMATGLGCAAFAMDEQYQSHFHRVRGVLCGPGRTVQGAG